MAVTGQTSAATQQGYAEQIAYNMQNNIPFSMTTAPNDPGAQAIATSIYNQAQVIAMTPQRAPTIGTQVAASTTGSNPGQASNIVGTIGADGSWTSNPNNPLQQAQVGSGAAVSSAVDNAVNSVTSPITTYLQAHVANYGLVIMGGLLVLGALLISQRKNIETIVTTGAKVAAL